MPYLTLAVQAQEYLAANGWDIEAAVTEFFAEQDEALQDVNTGGGQPLGAGGPSGQSLGDSSAPSTSDRPQQSSSGTRGRSSKKFATLGDFASSGGGHSSDEDDNPTKISLLVVRSLAWPCRTRMISKRRLLRRLASTAFPRLQSWKVANLAIGRSSQHLTIPNRENHTSLVPPGLSVETKLQAK